MTVIINGTTGITTPSVTNDGAYTGDGVSFADTTPANTLVTTTGGNVGIGTSSPISNGGYGGLSLNGTSGALFSLMTNGTETGRIASLDNETSVQCKASTGYINFVQGVSGGTERMRINSSGTVLIGKTTQNTLATVGVEMQGNGTTFITKTHGDGGGAVLYVNRLNVNGAAVLFYKNTTEVGNIAVTASATSYNSGSDYRLKDNIQPLTDALQKVALLKPSTWTWKADNTYGDGFIAHELAEVCPNAVTGEKDAVNEDGSIRPQGVDTSFLVATLTKAIQELNAKVDAQAAEIAVLKGVNNAS